MVLADFGLAALLISNILEPDNILVGDMSFNDMSYTVVNPNPTGSIHLIKDIEFTNMIKLITMCVVV